MRMVECMLTHPAPPKGGALWLIGNQRRHLFCDIFIVSFQKLSVIILILFPLFLVSFCNGILIVSLRNQQISTTIPFSKNIRFFHTPDNTPFALLCYISVVQQNDPFRLHTQSHSNGQVHKNSPDRQDMLSSLFEYYIGGIIIVQSRSEQFNPLLHRPIISSNRFRI